MLDAKIHRTRIRIIMTLVSLVGIIVIVRLFSLQIVNASFYKERAEHQYVTPSSEIFDRGNIYFTSKDGTTVAAATIANGFKITIAPSLVTNPSDTYAKLSALVPEMIDREDFIAKAAKKNDPYEEVADHVDDATAERITALHLPGVTLYREKWRFYPGGSLAAKTIGFVSYKGNALVGNYGLEEYYSDIVSRSGKSAYVNFFAEIFANMQSTIFKNKASTGDVVTSIEPTVQAELEHVIAGIENTWGSDSVGGIVLDPYTGEVVAMASVPTFDLNHFGAEKDVGIYNNPFVQNVYEMGSIVKPLVMAAGLNEGVVTPTTSYTDAGFIKVNDRTIYNFDKVGRGTATMQDVLNQSLNTGMVFVEQKMGKEVFKNYMLNHYKIGEKTGVDLPGEVNGLVSGLKGSNDVNYANAAFGQGIATTPLNIVRSFASLANGGTLITPHIVTEIQEENGKSKKITYPTSSVGLKPETLSTITNMLTKVVDDGYHRGMQHYSVAAKTGTAQIAKSNGGGYYTDRNLHSLIGYFPASKPRYVLYLYNVYPKGALFAIQTLGDPFFHMVQFLSNYYEITPDR